MYVCMHVCTCHGLQGIWDHRRIQEGRYDVCMSPPVGGEAVGRNSAGPLKNCRNSYPALLMYVCMYVCMNVCMCIRFIRVLCYMYVCMYVCIMYECISLSLYMVCMYASMYNIVCHMYVCMYVQYIF